MSVTWTSDSKTVSSGDGSKPKIAYRPARGWNAKESSLDSLLRDRYTDPWYNSVDITEAVYGVYGLLLFNFNFDSCVFWMVESRETLTLEVAEKGCELGLLFMTLFKIVESCVL